MFDKRVSDNWEKELDLKERINDFNKYKCCKPISFNEVYKLSEKIWNKEFE